MSDLQRPLNKRGQRDSLRLGRWLQDNYLIPDCIISSHSQRTRETVMNVCNALEFDTQDVHWLEALYHAGSQGLLRESLTVLESFKSIMLVAHNPGLDDLLEYLCPTSEMSYTTDAKLMTTASFAHIELPEDSNAISYQSGHLVQLIRPRDID